MFSIVVKSCNESHVNSCLHWEPKLNENDVKTELCPEYSPVGEGWRFKWLVQC